VHHDPDRSSFCLIGIGRHSIWFARIGYGDDRQNIRTFAHVIGEKMDNTIIEVIAILFGFLIRFGIPIGLTFLFSLYLRWLDRRWEAEAEAREAAERSLVYNKPCWEIRNCSSKTRNACPAYAQPQTPCWETFRVNGKLRRMCYTCKVSPPILA